MSRRWIGLGLLAVFALLVGCSGSNKNKITEPPIAPPKAAADLYAASTSPTRIILRWRDASDDETGFDVERRVGPTGDFQRIARPDSAGARTVPANVTSYEDSGVTDGTTYTYRVVAFRYTASAEASNTVTVLATSKRPPDRPSAPNPPDVSLTPGAPDIDETVPLTLAWTGTDPSGGSLTFDVLFGSTFGTMVVKASGLTETSYLLGDVTLSRNRHYFWRVIAHDETGVSAPSPIWGFNTRVDRDSVPAGLFVMGDTLRFLGGDSSAVNPLWHPGNPVNTVSYMIDRYLVTNQQYADFLNQALTTGKLWLGDSQVYNDARDALWATISPRDTDSDISFSVADSAFVVTDGREGFPVVQVSWYGADAYARYHGRRLPTEAEWEKAARGTAGDVLGYQIFEASSDTIGMGSPYPWGRWSGDQDLSRGNFLNSGDPYENSGRVRTTPPGFYDGSANLGYQTLPSASPYGAYDMSGNVWQWTKDWYDVYRAPHTPPATGNFKVVRGGSFAMSYGSATVWNRSYVSPSTTDRTIGFRTVGTSQP